VHERDGLGAQPLGLARQPIEVQTRPELHRELGQVGADPIHDLAHQEAELPGADYQHAIPRLDDGQRTGLERGTTRAR
jgi:hypothetical protein